MRPSLLALTMVIFLVQAACRPAARETNQAEADSSANSTPASTAPIFTFVPPVSPTPRLPVSEGTALPSPEEPISAENAGQIVELARWGKGVITDAVQSNDGEWIAVASTLGVSILHSDTLEETIYFGTDASINSIVFSSNGETLVTGLNDNTIKVWKVANGILLDTFEYPVDEKAQAKKDYKDEVTGVALSPDGSLLLAGSTDGSVCLWEVSSGNLRSTYKNHTIGVSSVFFSPNGEAFFSSSWDGTVRMMNVSDGSLIRAFGSQLVVDAAISADGGTLVTYDYGLYASRGKIIVWDVASGKKLQTITEGDEYSSNWISRVALSPDGQFVAAAWRDHSAKTWSVSTGTPQNTFEDLQPEGGYYNVEFDVAFSPDGQSLLLAGSDSVGVWDLNKGTLLNSVKIKSEAVYDIALSPDGKMIGFVEGARAGFLHVTDGSLQSYEEDIRSSGSLEYLPDGTTIAISMYDETARLWPLSDQGVRKTFEFEKKEYISSITVSPDGELIAMGSSYPAGKVELRNITDGTLLRTLTLDSTYGYVGLAFSPDGEYLAASIPRHIGVFRVSDGKRINSLKGYGRLAFSPDNTLLAAATDDKTARVWAIPGGETVFELTDLPDNVLSVAFSPDGTLLALGEEDGTIQLILVSDGSQVESWRMHSQAVSDLVFSSDGSMLISSSYDGTIRVWGLKH